MRTETAADNSLAVAFHMLHVAILFCLNIELKVKPVKRNCDIIS